MDFTGRFESLQSDFDKICSSLQVKPTTLPHVLKTSHASYPEYYEEETIGIVEQLYAADIAEFGYRFGD